MKFRYIERCAQGYVEFRRADEVVQMHSGEVVDVPDWLGAKLANNNHFEQVTDDGVAVAARRGGWPKGKLRKPVIGLDAESSETDTDQ